MSSRPLKPSLWPIACVAIALWWIVAPLGGLAQAQTPDPAQTPSYKLFGSVGWLVRYGLGDGRGLAVKNFSKGFFFSQSIELDADISVGVARPVPGVLTLLAQLDNEQPQFLQSVRMRFDAEDWTAEYGDFPMGRPESPFAAASRTLKGLKVDWQPREELTVGGTLSQVSGVKQSKTFRGNTAEETVQYAFHPPNRPLEETPYLQNLHGLQYFPLGGSYVEGFTRIELAFETGSDLEGLLRSYDLGFLTETIRDDPVRELDPSSYTVIFTGTEYFLALKREFAALLRERVLTYIDDYNLAQGLSGEELEEYPLTEGTDYEQGFLEQLGAFARIRVDSLSFAAEDAARERFYALGRTKIQEDSVQVEVIREGEFVSIDDPTLAGYAHNVYPEIGIVELQFPDEFFEDPDAAVRVTYRYRSESKTYVLGLTVLKGSEKVYLNGKPLQRGTDYLIEYENGFLLLFKDVGPEDVLRIEYETARGGLFGFSEYSRGFQGVTFGYQPFENLDLNLDLFRTDDTLRSDIDPTTVETMPNTHTVVGLTGQLKGEGYQADFELGFGVNRFPPDDNQKTNLPNRVNAIVALRTGGRGLVLFGHRNGLLVTDGLNWNSYSVSQGLLAGRTVYDIASSPGRIFIATSGGLSVVELDPGDPTASLARRANWTTVAVEEGLPDPRAYAVLVHEGALWVGTEKGLARTPLSRLTDPDSWTIYREKDHPELVSDRVFQLAQAGDALYVGTDRGLSTFDPETGAFHAVEELRGRPIHDLVVEGETVYVATERGVRALREGRGVGWPVVGRDVAAVAVHDGSLWYGTPEGLYELARGLIPETRGRAITAVGVASGALWAGEEATADYELRLYEAAIQDSNVRLHAQTETGLDGRAAERFLPIPAAEHTDLGWLGRISLAKDWGPLTLSGALESVSPGFSPVGALERRDQLQLSLGAGYALSPSANLQARHEEGVLGLFGSPKQVIRDGIGLSFAPEGGPQLDLDYTLERVDRHFAHGGFDELRSSYSLSASEKFLDDRLTLRLGYERMTTEDLDRPLYSSVESTLTGEAAFQALPGLRLHLGYRQPLSWRFGDARGGRALEWGAQWSTSLALGRFPLAVQANYGGSGQLPVGAGAGRSALDQNAGISARGATVNLGGLVLTPQLNLSLNSGDLLGPTSSLQFGGKGTLEASWRSFEGRLRYERTQLVQEYSRLTRIGNVLNVSLSYLGLTQLRPTFEFSGSLDTFIHPFLGRKTTGQYSLALGAGWQRRGSPLSADLSLRRQVVSGDAERTVSYSLQQSLSYALHPRLTPRLILSADYLQGERRGEEVSELSGELSLEGNFTPIPEWRGTISGTYLFGLDAVYPQRSYGSFALTVNFGRDFAFF